MRLTIPLFLALLMVALGFAAEGVATGPALPEYQVRVTDRRPGMKLALDGVIAQAIDEATLKALGEKVYRESGGKDYKNVFINWVLPHYGQGEGVWAVTNFTEGGAEVKILAMKELVQRFEALSDKTEGEPDNN